MINQEQRPFNLIRYYCDCSCGHETWVWSIWGWPGTSYPSELEALKDVLSYQDQRIASAKSGIRDESWIRTLEVSLEELEAKITLLRSESIPERRIRGKQNHGN